MLLASSTMSSPAARAPALLAPSGVVTVNTNCMSPWWNLSVSSWVARADSEVGSWNPPADRLLATGMPKIAAPTIVSDRDAR